MNKPILFLISTFLLTNHAVAQEKEIAINLTVDHNQQAEVIRGMPAILHLRLVSLLQTSYTEVLGAVPDTIQNDPGLLRHLDSVFAPIEISGPGTPWYSAVFFRIESADKRRLTLAPFHIIRPQPDTVSRFNHEENLHIYYGIDPETTLGWKPGEMNIRGGVAFQKDGDTLWSRPIKLIITNQEIKKPKSLLQSQMVNLAEYWLRRGLCEKARPFAETVWANDSSSIANAMLMADVQACKGNNAATLAYLIKAYEEYMRQPDRFYEPPDVLLRRISEIQEGMLHYTE
jgi:hypothetical protein